MTKAEDIYNSHVNYEWNDVSDNLKKSIISAINEAINYTHCCEELCEVCNNDQVFETEDGYTADCPRCN